MQKQYIKLIAFNLGLIIFDVICLSNGFLGLLEDKTNSLKFALGLSIAIMSVVAFFLVNYRMLTSSSMVKRDLDLDSLDTNTDYIKTLNKLRNKRTFEVAISDAIGQIERATRKYKTFEDVYYNKFKEEASESYGFVDIIEDTNSMLYKNIDRIISILTIFDYSEYITLSRDSNKHSKKLDLMQENIDEVNELIRRNEEILLNEDKLILEMSKIGDSEEDDEVNLQRINDIVDSMKILRVGDKEI